MTQVEGPPVQQIGPRRGVTDLGLAELQHKGHLLWLLTTRELKLRYVQTILGPLWVVVTPLVPALLFTFVFTKVATVDTGGVPYLVLVTAAMAPWGTVSRILGRGGGALVSQRHVLTKVYFPRLLVPLSTMLACVADHLVALAIVALAMVQAGQPATWRLWLLPVLAVWTLVLALAITLLVAAMTVHRRDLLSALPIAIQGWLYLSPVAYPLSAVPEHLRALMALNPITSLVEAHRWAVLGTTEIGQMAIVGALLETVVLLVVGLASFRIAERTMADVL